VIRHVVIWRLKQEAKRDGQIDGFDSIQRNLERYARMCRSAAIGAGNQRRCPTDAADLLLYAEFASWERCAVMRAIRCMRSCVH